jgi:glycine dehydrogenase
MAEKYHANFRYFADGSIGISLDETTTVSKMPKHHPQYFEAANRKKHRVTRSSPNNNYNHKRKTEDRRPARTSEFLTHPVFNTHHSRAR